MICPYCEKEMEVGYIQSRDGLWWADRKRVVAAIPPMRGKRMCLGTEGTILAHHCEDCQKLVIAYEDDEI